MAEHCAWDGDGFSGYVIIEVLSLRYPGIIFFSFVLDDYDTLFLFAELNAGRDGTGQDRMAGWLFMRYDVLLMMARTRRFIYVLPSFGTDFTVTTYSRPQSLSSFLHRRLYLRDTISHSLSGGLAHGPSFFH